jgi:hypothetical protein
MIKGRKIKKEEIGPNGKQVPFATAEQAQAASEKTPISHQFCIFK